MIYASLANFNASTARIAHLVESYHFVAADDEAAGGIAIAVDRAQGAGEAVVLQLGLLVVLIVLFVVVAVRVDVAGGAGLIGGAGIIVRVDDSIVVESIWLRSHAGGMVRSGWEQREMDELSSAQ